MIPSEGMHFEKGSSTEAGMQTCWGLIPKMLLSCNSPDICRFWSLPAGFKYSNGRCGCGCCGWGEGGLSVLLKRSHALSKLLHIGFQLLLS